MHQSFLKKLAVVHRALGRLPRLGAAVLFILAILSLLSQEAANAGCFCMMDSKSVVAGYNKTGFEDYTTNTIKQFYLRSEETDIRNTILTSDDENCSYAYKDVIVNNFDYMFTNMAAVPPPSQCRTWTLPHHSRDEITEHIRFSSSSSYIQADDDSWDLGNFGGEIDTANGCDGSWSDLSDSGSMCAPDYDWPYPDLIPSPPYTTATYQNGDTFSGYTAQYSSDDDGVDYSYLEKDQTVLSIPFTDKMLRDQIIERLPPLTNAWTTNYGSTAYYNIGADHACGGGAKMQYRLKVPNSDKDTRYLVHWQQVQSSVPGDSTNSIPTDMTEWIQGTGDPVNPAYGDKVYFVDVPDKSPCYIWTTAPDVIKTVSSGDDDGDGPGDGDQGSQPGGIAGNT